MIETARGDVLEADTEAVVNSVNCAGAMGRGIALQFREAFPENYRRYKQVCDAGDLSPGEVFVHDRGGLFGASGGPRYVINLATIDHWTDRSSLETVASGLDALVRAIDDRGIDSVALPPIGCGYGGLDWADVRAAIEARFEGRSDVRAVVYPPGARS
jgi:O-acetyl-ADP-ribose deacetylase (regulator of RNase III)